MCDCTCTCEERDECVDPDCDGKADDTKCHCWNSDCNCIGAHLDLDFDDYEDDEEEYEE